MGLLSWEVNQRGPSRLFHEGFSSHCQPELLIDGTRVAYGSIEMYDKDGLLLGYCWADGAEAGKLFMVDSALSATNSIVWYGDMITALKKGMPRFDSSKCRTFLDFRKRRWPMK